MHRRRLRVPRNDNSCLLVPPLCEVAALARQNQRYLDGLAFTWPGTDARTLRQQARNDIARGAETYSQQLGLPTPAPPTGPMIMTGHQPALYHPGVWFKNFVCHALARHLGGSAWNVIVDNDVPKSLAVAVPGGTPARPTVDYIELDRQSTRLPFEEMPVVDPGQVLAFGRRVQQAMAAWPVEPLATRWWSSAMAGLQDRRKLGDAVTLARRRIEHAQKRDRKAFF